MGRATRSIQKIDEIKWWTKRLSDRKEWRKEWKKLIKQRLEL